MPACVGLAKAKKSHPIGLASFFTRVTE